VILDERTEFVDSLALTTAGVKGDVYDTISGTSQYGTSNFRDLGAGYPCFWVVTLETAATGGPADFQLVTADDTALTTNAVILATIPGVVVTTAGQKFAMSLPSGQLYKQYLGVKVAGTAATGGTFSSFLVLNVANSRAYKDANN